MARLLARSVEITLESGEVLHFLTSAGDVVVVNQVVTQPTGTPASHPRFIRYYNVTVSHKDDSDRD